MFRQPVQQVGRNGVRSFSSTITRSKTLKIGYVPEHFSTPLAFAQKHYGLDAELTPVPLGTGALATRLKASTQENQPLDVAVGLTEGFVADLGKARAVGQNAHYGIVGTYVQSPLCWAVSTGANRNDVNSVEELKGKKVGVSRIGSGSYVMSYVLADQKGWLDWETKKDPFEIVPIGDFAALRRSVNEKRSDFFMWEHFTTNKYWQNGELKRIGEIYTPWPSWVIAARESAMPEMGDLIGKINQGVKHFKENPEEAIEYITSNMHYSKEDATEWMKTVEFPDDVGRVDSSMVDETVATLQKAGVLNDKAGGSDHMILVRDQRT